VGVAADAVEDLKGMPFSSSMFSVSMLFTSSWTSSTRMATSSPFHELLRL
jgi:hypothetical protein